MQKQLPAHDGRDQDTPVDKQTTKGPGKRAFLTYDCRISSDKLPTPNQNTYNHIHLANIGCGECRAGRSQFQWESCMNWHPSCLGTSCEDSVVVITSKRKGYGRTEWNGLCGGSGYGLFISWWIGLVIFAEAAAAGRVVKIAWKMEEFATIGQVSIVVVCVFCDRTSSATALSIIAHSCQHQRSGVEKKGPLYDTWGEDVRRRLSICCNEVGLARKILTCTISRCSLEQHED